MFRNQIVHDEGKYKIESDGSLQIIGVGRSDSGSYTCIADNGVGTSALKQSQLDVKGMNKSNQYLETCFNPSSNNIKNKCNKLEKTNHLTNYFDGCY